MRRNKNNLYKKYGKRLFDLGLTLSAMTVLFPLMVCVALLIKAKLGRPVMFRQVRPGLRGLSFTIYKFRTMTDTRDGQGNLLPDEMRLTRLGELLRASSVDELPELFNVIKGDMSLVGPRPLRMEYLTLYSAEQARRHEVRPGITGWAQINGRNATTWPRRLKMDVWYVENHNFSLDIKILCLTVFKVLKREGISNERHATMPPFQGEC